MTKQKEEITQLANWCQEARKILGKGMRGDSSTMENRIKGVESRLKKLSESRTATDKQVFEAGMENFRLLTQDHQKATDVYNEAKRVLAKHDETYMPKEVADALKEQGEWRGDGEQPSYGQMRAVSSGS